MYNAITGVADRCIRHLQSSGKARKWVWPTESRNIRLTELKKKSGHRPTLLLSPRLQTQCFRCALSKNGVDLSRVKLFILWENRTLKWFGHNEKTVALLFFNTVS